jgi:hypothetical protein
VKNVFRLDGPAGAGSWADEGKAGARPRRPDRTNRPKGSRGVLAIAEKYILRSGKVNAPPPEAASPFDFARPIYTMDIYSIDIIQTFGPRRMDET